MYFFSERSNLNQYQAIPNSSSCQKVQEDQRFEERNAQILQDLAMKVLSGNYVSIRIIYQIHTVFCPELIFTKKFGYMQTPPPTTSAKKFLAIA